MGDATCNISACERPVKSNGMCGTHSWRAWKFGDPQAEKPLRASRKTAVKAAFWSKVSLPDPDTGCMIWLASRKPAGYGQFNGRGRLEYAHRFAYELLVGPIPDGLVIDHLCRNRACVRPDHLEPVTSRTNSLRGFGPAAQCARRTHCTKGHPYDEENTARMSTTGRRYCKICNRENARKYRRKAAS